MRTYKKSMCILVCFFIAFFCGEIQRTWAQGSPAKTPETDTTEIEEQIAKDASTEINVKNADIAAIVRIFSKKTKRNYILDERVQGKVSIYLPGKVTAEESIRILDSVLTLKGFTTVPIGENLWKIVPAQDAKQSTIPTLTGKSSENPGSAMVTRLIQLKYVSADDMKQLIGGLVSSNGLVNAYTGTNSLIIIDSEDNIQRLHQLIETMDVPFSNREMTIIPVKHADAVDIAEKLNQILLEGSDSSSSSSSSTPGLDAIRARLREAAAGGAAAGKTPAAVNSSASTASVSVRALEPKIIADERTNSIIVIADEDTTARIRALIDQLDSEVNKSGFRFYVYQCQHANAEELADVLGGLTGGSSTSGGTRSTNSLSSSSPFSNTNTNSRNRGNRFNRTQDRISGQRRTPGRSRSENGTGGTGATSVNLGEDISITADPATNSLVIYASKSDYEKIKDLITKLDIRRRQVLVEAMLLEVRITDDGTTAMEFIGSTGGADGGVLTQSTFDNLPRLLSDPTAIGGFSIAAASSGSLTLPGNITIPSQSVLLTAVRNNSNVNVLSAPNILATDNEQAEIVVGENVPFLASQSTSADNLNNTFNQIDRQDVGITLRITPQISSQNYVTLNMFTEVSNVISSNELGPTTTIRTSETTVVTRDSQMVVIGGLMSDNIAETESGVPFLKDVPVLGHMFKSVTEDVRRTNLLIFITPRIIRDQYDARDVTIEGRNWMRNEIHANNVHPPRHEVLEDVAIDRVISGEIDTENPPAQIPAPPAQKKSRIILEGNPEFLNPDSQQQQKKSPETKLPSESFLDHQRSTPPAKRKSFTEENKPKASLRFSLPEKSPPSAGTYVVLEFIDRPDKAKNLPFAQSIKQKKIGIIVPKGSSLSAFQFFEAGKVYRYQHSKNSVQMRSTGVFTNPEDIQKLYPELTNHWYLLSPHEILNLGRIPWQRVQ